MRAFPLLAALFVLGALAACGGTATEKPPAETGLPAVEVDDVAGGKVDLAGLTPSDKPLLVWAWSPI